MLAGTTTASEFQLSVPLVVASAVASLAWLAILAGVLATRRLPSIAPAGAGIDLPPESPAVAGMLANDFTIPSETAPAILLDLAARRIVDLDEVQPGRTICRLRGRADMTGLSAADTRVLEAIRGRAIDGVVPTEALTSGPEEQSKGWHRSLAREVVQEAQQAGLTVNRWPKGLVTGLGAGLALPVALVAFAFRSEDIVRDDQVATVVVAGAVAIIVIALGAIVVGRLGTSIAQLPTESGEPAAARARGLEEHLSEDRALDELPPASVKVRGRHFAYAAAFGAAHLAVELLPMGTEDDHRAWSRFGARWRRVKVRYPRVLPPAWGKHPAFALFLAVLWGGVAVLAIYGIDAMGSSDPPQSVSSSQWDDLTTGALIALAPAIAVLAWALWVLVRALPDLWSTRTVIGEIVRDRRFRKWSSSNDTPRYSNYLAVDDGTSDRVSAWRMRGALWALHDQGEVVTAEITPRLRYVRSITRTVGPGGS